MSRRYWRPETGIFLGLWLVLMIGGRSRFLQDPGTFWHTVVGQQMLSTGKLIYQDSFSFTFAAHTWSPHQWLGECVMALLHQVDGLDTLLLFTVTLLTCLYTWLAHRLIRGGLHWSLAALVVGLTVAASSSHFHIRSHIATIVFLGWTYGFLCDFEAGRGGIGRLFWLVPIYVLWTNVHGGMLGGLGTMGFALAGWYGWRLIGRSSPITDYRKALLFIALIACCALTILVNPYGLRMAQIWKQIMDGDLPQIIVEHAPLDPAKPAGWIVLVFGAVYLVVLAGVWPKWPRVTWLLPLIWFYLACTRIRHAPLFSITAALAIADMLPHTRWAAWIARTGSDLFQFPSREVALTKPSLAWGAALLPIGVVVLALYLQMERVPVPVVGHGWVRLDPTYWPVELLPKLAAYQNSRAGGTPIFNEYLHGGFLIYQTPGFRVFVDDRCELYGDQWLKDYVLAEGTETAKYIKDSERIYPEFDLAMTRTGSGYDDYFATCSDWVPVQQTEAATLYQRVAPLEREPQVRASSEFQPAR
jgi:hypothetical protein